MLVLPTGNERKKEERREMVSWRETRRKKLRTETRLTPSASPGSKTKRKIIVSGRLEKIQHTVQKTGKKRTCCSKTDGPKHPSNFVSERLVDVKDCEKIEFRAR